MKNTKWLVLAGIAILMMTMGCEKQMGLIAPESDDVGVAATSKLPIQYNPGGSWFTYFYYMPGSGTAGTPVVYPMSVGNDDGSNGCGVSVWDDGVNIYVKYNTAPNWWLTQVHVDIGTAHDSLAHNKMFNLQPGQFRFPSDKQFNINPYVQQYTVPCEWQSSWPGGANPDPGYDPTKGLLICAHSVVCQWDAVNQMWVNFQTGTGAGGPPPPSFKIPSLPDGCVHFTVGLNGWPRCYYWTTLSGVPVADPPYNVWNGDDWAAWCAQKGPGTGTGINYDVHLYSIFDSDLPNIALYNDPDWPKIGWLLNHWQDYTGATSVEVQNVIWYELGYIPKPTAPPVAQQMATDADLQIGWRPSSGEIVPVICHPCVPNDYQLLFIEVDP